MRRLLVAAALAFPACGSDGSPAAPPPVTVPPTPAAIVTATGNGVLVLHPSLDTRFAVALQTPIRMRETGGGTATWNFARMQIFLNGREVERTELGAPTIAGAGFATVPANSDRTINVIFRFNSDDFDRIDLTLGFSDRRDGSTFDVVVPFNTFSDVAVSPTPVSRSHIPL